MPSENSRQNALPTSSPRAPGWRPFVRDIGGADALTADDHLHPDALERQLLIIAEAAAKLRGQVEALEPGTYWNAIRGMGNFIRHDYDGVEDEIIERVLRDALEPLAQACHRLLRHLKPTG